MIRSFYPYFLNIAVLLLVCFLLFSCDDNGDDMRPELEIPNTYDGTNFTSSTTVQRAVLTQLSALTVEMQRGRQGGSVTQEALVSLFKAGSPSVEATTTTYYVGRLNGTGGWFDELAKSSGGSVYTPGAPQGQGGTLGGYLFDENGLELEQVVEKNKFYYLL